MDPWERLHADVGTWDARVTVTFPGSPPSHSTGVSVQRLTGGGKWLVADFEGSTGHVGHGVYGWDPSRDRYVSTWVDNMRSFLVVAEGRWDEANGEMTYDVDAEINGRRMRWREITRRDGDDSRVWRQVTEMGGEWVELMRVVYTRRPASGSPA
jgi:hypothetical protein